jgi:hypothetical protein
MGLKVAIQLKFIWVYHCSTDALCVRALFRPGSDGRW